MIFIHYHIWNLIASRRSILAYVVFLFLSFTCGFSCCPTTTP